MRKGLSLYIHIPFCNSKCNYCSFVSVVAKDETKLRYIESLKKEIEIRGKELAGNYQVTSVYIGGGTPSCLPDGEVKRIMQQVYKNFVVKNDAEITIEVNPNTLTADKVKEYLFSGINRISMGLQCASKSILGLMGRTHTAEDFVRAVKLLRDNGISNISGDIIIGYPRQTLSDVKASLELLTQLKIPHISTYMLSVEEGTKLHSQIQKHELKEPSEDETVKVYSYCVNYLKTRGYSRYEVSNFARAGFKSRHNQVYWKRWNYVGLGVAAHSYLHSQRFANTSDIATYVNFLETKGLVPVASAHTLTTDEKKEEFVMLSLRKADGFDPEEYYKEFGENFLATRKDKLASLIKGGFLILNPQTNQISATDKGFLVLNKIIEDLC